MKVSDFDYELPSKFIAQTPMEPRDHSRLMVLHRTRKSIEHCLFYEIINYLRPGDVLVLNDSRVIPARLFGYTEDGSKVEVFLLRRVGDGLWETLVRPGKKFGVGVKMRIGGGQGNLQVIAQVIDKGKTGLRIIHFSAEGLLTGLGEVPLPPYIKVPLAVPDRYQTIYAKAEGSVAAPTAGLHFTHRLLLELERKGIKLVYVTLHIGLDTFRPVRVDDPKEHPIHQEYGIVSEEAAVSLNQARRDGKRIVVVGTSTVRLLEAAAQEANDTKLQPFSGWVSLLILPGYEFRLIEAMVTNFHLPRSTLLLLVSALAGREFILQAYEEAKSEGYRFYSFGDAMLIM